MKTMTKIVASPISRINSKRATTTTIAMTKDVTDSKVVTMMKMKKMIKRKKLAGKTLPKILIATKTMWRNPILIRNVGMK